VSASALLRLGALSDLTSRRRHDTSSNTPLPEVRSSSKGALFHISAYFDRRRSKRSSTFCRRCSSATDRLRRSFVTAYEIVVAPTGNRLGDEGCPGNHDEAGTGQEHALRVGRLDFLPKTHLPGANHSRRLHGNRLQRCPGQREVEAGRLSAPRDHTRNAREHPPLVVLVDRRDPEALMAHSPLVITGARSSMAIFGPGAELRRVGLGGRNGEAGIDEAPSCRATAACSCTTGSLPSDSSHHRRAPDRIGPLPVHSEVKPAISPRVAMMTARYLHCQSAPN
jgi:hypothetical protein